MHILERLTTNRPRARHVATKLGLVQPPSETRLFLLDMLPRRSVGVEIGVHEGDFSYKLLRAVAPTSLHLIDPWRHEASDQYKDAWYGGMARGGQAEMDERHARVCRRFEGEIRAGQVTIHRGDSADVLAGFPDDYFDWTYIDGNHLYEFVKRDLELSFAKTKPGGLIAGDDYVQGEWWQGGVKRAVDECARQRSISGFHLRNRQFVMTKSA